MAAKHGELVSRMASIQEALAMVDYNLRETYDSDPGRYAGPRREVAREEYEISDKLGVLGQRSWLLGVIHAASSAEMALYREQDGDEPNLDLLRKAERLWTKLLGDLTMDRDARCWLAILRPRLADGLAARGHADESAEWRLQSLATVRGNPGLCYDTARQLLKRIQLIDHDPAALQSFGVAACRRRLVDQAIAMIQQAVADGFNDVERLRSDPWLGTINADPRFSAIVADLGFPADPFAHP
jgi:hypothetical protein